MKKLMIIFSMLFFLAALFFNATDPQKSKLTKQWASEPSFKIPESVCYDSERDVLYVSNIDGNPRQKDGNGFISIMDLDGNIKNLEWITGLHAPKGMGIHHGRLFVADIDEIIEIDIDQGKISNRFQMNDAGMFNDITVDASGGVYFTDTDKNKIHYLKDGRIDTWAYADLSRPNGLLAEADRLILASMGSQDVVSYDLKTKEKSVWVEGIGKGDGLVPTQKPGYYLVSDWSGAIYLISPDRHKEKLLDTSEEEMNTADIESIPAKSMVFVPTFADNRVIAYKLELD